MLFLIIIYIYIIIFPRYYDNVYVYVPIYIYICSHSCSLFLFFPRVKIAWRLELPKKNCPQQILFSKKGKLVSYSFKSPFWGTRPGKHTKNFGKSPFLMGQSTISMVIFNSYVNVYQRVYVLETHSRTYFRDQKVVRKSVKWPGWNSHIFP